MTALSAALLCTGLVTGPADAATPRSVAPSALRADDTPPSVTTPPQSATVPAGTDATFTVQVTGDPTPSVQWQVLPTWDRSGEWTDLDDATGTSYTVTRPTLQDSGNQYRAVLSSDAGYEESAPATLTVTGTAPSEPQGVVARQTGTGEVTLSWSTPSSNGDSGISSYDAGWSGGEFGSGTTVAATARSAVFSGLETGRYVFSVAAANLAGPGERAFTTPVLVLGPRPALTPSASQLVSGQRLTLAGLAKPGARVTVERALPGRGWRVLGRVTASRAGSYSVPVVATRTASYRSRVGSAASDALVVAVASRVTTTATRVATRTYRLHGSVRPAAARQLVAVYAGPAGSPLTRIGSDRTDRRGAWSLRHRFPSGGTWAVKVVSAATRATTAGTRTTSVTVR